MAGQVVRLLLGEHARRNTGAASPGLGSLQRPCWKPPASVTSRWVVDSASRSSLQECSSLTRILYVSTQSRRTSTDCSGPCLDSDWSTSGRADAMRSATAATPPAPAGAGGGPAIWPCRRPQRSSPGRRRRGPATARRRVIRQKASQVRGSNSARIISSTPPRQPGRRLGVGLDTSLPTARAGCGISAIWRCAVLPPRASALPCRRR